MNVCINTYNHFVDTFAQFLKSSLRDILEREGGEGREERVSVCVCEVIESSLVSEYCTWRLKQELHATHQNTS